MIKTIEEAKNLAREFNLLKKEEERLQFLVKHNDKLCIHLDNDSATVSFIDVEDEELQEKLYDIYISSLSYRYGWEDGVYILFDFIGITVADG